jgi:hypothetical protein
MVVDAKEEIVREPVEHGTISLVCVGPSSATRVTAGLEQKADGGGFVAMSDGNWEVGGIGRLVCRVRWMMTESAEHIRIRCQNIKRLVIS